MSQSAVNFYALLVGVSVYHPDSGVDSLRGCANDVDEMARLLREKFDVPPDNMVTLVNDQATHAAIKQAMQTHLVARAENWPPGAAPDNRPDFLLYFSGHGSQARDLTGQEPDGMDETIVPYDSRTPGVYDLRDWELGQMVESLSRASDNITVILDSCHSGSGTRRLDQSAVRSCPADLRPQPFYRPITGAQRSIAGAGWELGAHHVLIAGCRDRELSHEMVIVDDEREVWRGALSYFLQQEAQKMNPAAPFTCRELVERVRNQVTQRFAAQTPQCEGDVNREFLGGLRPLRDRAFTVVEQRDGLYWLDAGIAHGIRSGALLSVYAPDARLLAQADAPLGRLMVVEERLSRSACRRIGDGDQPLLWGRAVMEAAGVGGLTRTVRLAIDDADLTASLRRRLDALPTGDPRLDVSPYVRVVDAPADFTVTLSGGQLAILNRMGVQPTVLLDRDDVEGCALALAHITRYLNALELKNDAPNSSLAGMVTLELQRLVVDPQASRPTSLPFPAQPGGEIIVQSGERIVLAMGNRADQPLHVGLFSFGADFEIVKLFPRGDGVQEALPAGRSYWLGRSPRKSEQLEAFLPPGVAEMRDVYKLIASPEEINFDLLAQEPLAAPPAAHKAVIGAAGQPPSALDLLLARATGLIASRNDPPPAVNAWTTVELVVHTVASRAEMTQQLRGGEVTPAATFPISFYAPPGCNGSVRVLTPRQVQLFSGDAVLQPPGLAAFSQEFQPLGIGPDAFGAHGAVIELELDEAARRKVTPATPLLLQLGWALAEDTAGVMALVSDGATFFPAGCAPGAASVVPVEWLPQPDAEGFLPAEGAHGGATPLRLVLYRLVRGGAPQVGLRRVSISPGDDVAEVRRVAGCPLRFEQPRAAIFRPGQRLALVIPEFMTESGELAAWLCRAVTPAYDHVLVFDYETPQITANARLLLDALRRLDADQTPDLQIDLFAHGMGALLARQVIEPLRGDAFIRRCFLIAPPNQGIPLAASTVWSRWLLSLALNRAGASAPRALVRWALGELPGPAAGPAGLRPQSELLIRLKRLHRPLRTAYFVLAGDASLSPEDTTLGRRLARQLATHDDFQAAALPTEKGDLLVSLESMGDLGSKSARAALVETFTAPCNHFAYLDDAQALKKLAAWVTNSS